MITEEAWMAVDIFRLYKSPQEEELLFIKLKIIKYLKCCFTKQYEYM